MSSFGGMAGGSKSSSSLLDNDSRLFGDFSRGTSTHRLVLLHRRVSLAQRYLTLQINETRQLNIDSNHISPATCCHLGYSGSAL
jgi:hypothetical protein